MTEITESGWIKLYRNLLDKAVWKCSTYEQRVIYTHPSLNYLVWPVCKSLQLIPLSFARSGIMIPCGYICQPGQTITSLKSIAKAVGGGITIQKIRTVLTRFEKNYQFLTSKSTNKNRLITICNWKTYQCQKNSDNKADNKQLTSR